MRSRTCAVAAGLLTLLLLPSSAAAQEERRVGLTMGIPGAVGLIWQASDRVAVRPEFQFSHLTSESTSPQLGLSSASEGWSVSPGVSVLFYLQRWDHLRTYVSPRFSFTRSTNSFVPSGAIDAAESTNKSYTGSGSFGAQYALGDRFSLFAEIGLSVTRTTGSTDLSSSETSGRQWTTRTGVGAAFYF